MIGYICKYTLMQNSEWNLMISRLQFFCNFYVDIGLFQKGATI